MLEFIGNWHLVLRALLLFGLPAQSLLSAWSCSLLCSYLLESPWLTFLFHSQYPFILKIKESTLQNHYCLMPFCLDFFFLCGCFVQPQLLLNFTLGCSESWLCSCNQLRLHNTSESGYMKGALQTKAQLLTILF